MGKPELKTLKQIHILNAQAPPDFSLPHQVMQVSQCLTNGKKRLMRVELALEKLSHHLNTGQRLSDNR